MTLRAIYFAIITILLFIFFYFSPAASMDDPGFIVKRLVICENIADNEPVAIRNIFSADIEKIYCFLEAGNIEQDTVVTFVWYLEKQEMARVPLLLEKGHRWRTFSSKKIAGRKGKWQVDLQDSFGIVISSVSFMVQ